MTKNNIYGTAEVSLEDFELSEEDLLDPDELRQVWLIKELVKLTYDYLKLNIGQHLFYDEFMMLLLNHSIFIDVDKINVCYEHDLDIDMLASQLESFVLYIEYKAEYNELFDGYVDVLDNFLEKKTY